jgi:hypothetical protein
MTTETQPFFTAPNLPLLSVPTEGAAAILADYTDSDEFWILVVDAFGFETVLSIMDAHYSDCEASDRFAYISEHKGWTLGTFVLRRKLMSARQYRFQLSKRNVLKTEKELLETGVLLISADFNRSIVRAFARTLDLEPRDGEMAVSE